MPCRIYASGLARTQITKYYAKSDGSERILEEDHLGDFFHFNGCNVEDVRLMVCPKTNVCRGFAFIDFEDEESLQKALTYHGEKDPCVSPPGEGRVGLHTTPGHLQIERAKQPNREAMEMQQRLLQEREHTDGMERALRLKEASCKELRRQINANQTRQGEMQASWGVDTQLHREAARQDEIRRAVADLTAAEAALHVELRAAAGRTRALEDLVGSADGEQTRRHNLAAERDLSFGMPDSATPDTSEAGASEADGAPAASEGTATTFDAGLPRVAYTVKNTFIQFDMPLIAPELRRYKTAPAVPAAWGQSPIANSSMREGDADGCPDADDDGKVSEGVATWQLKRQASGIPSSVSRRLLDEKIEDADAESDSFALAAGLGSPAKSPVADSACGTAGLLLGNCREVRLRNLPQITDEEKLEAMIKAEFARLWQACLGRGPPTVESIHFGMVSFGMGRQDSRVSMRGRADGSEAIVIFEDAEEAGWLVDTRSPDSWSSPETITVSGRVIHAEWLPRSSVSSAAATWLRIRNQADTEVSSHVSYESAATKASCSEEVNKQAYAKMASRKSAAPAALASKAGGSAPVSSPPPLQRASAAGVPSCDQKLFMNRTVILDGLPKELPSHTLRSEILQLLKRLWSVSGYEFAAERDLLRGQEGITVRPGRQRGDENDGSALLKFRSTLCARFVKEQARERLKVAGKQVRVLWAKPKTGQ